MASTDSKVVAKSESSTWDNIVSSEYALSVSSSVLGAVLGGGAANSVRVNYESTMVGVLAGLVVLIAKLIHSFAVLPEVLSPKWIEGTRMAAVNLHIAYFVIPLIVVGASDKLALNMVGDLSRNRATIRLLADVLGGVASGVLLAYVDREYKLSLKAAAVLVEEKKKE